MMRDRLLRMKELLSPDGPIWVHLDDAEAHRMRSLLDEVMGPENFITTVIWQKIHARNNSAQHFSADHDFIHVYAKDAREWRPNRLSRTAKSDADFWNPDDVPRGPWRRSDLTASKPYADGHYEWATALVPRRALTLGPIGRTSSRLTCFRSWRRQDRPDWRGVQAWRHRLR